MAIILSCFLSCSEHKKDDEVVTFFEKLLEAFEITPYRAMKKGEPRPPAEKIREQIEQKDCLIAVATRRDKIADKSAWRTATFIEQEIGMAFEKRKPVMVFFESGVEASGVTPYIMDYATFDRAKLLESIPEITQRLNKLKDKLLENQALPIASDHVKEEIADSLKINLDGSWIGTTEIEVSCVGDYLAAIGHERFLPPGSGDLALDDYKFKFYSIFHEGGGNVKYVERSRGPKAILWTANFEPPLRQNEKAKYGFRQMGRDTYPLTLEAIEGMIREGKWFLNEPFAEEGWQITAPTKRLNFSIQFPEGYHIDKPKFRVMLGFTRYQMDSEIKRLKDSKSFRPRDFGNQWQLALDVENPQVGLYYQILWMPPPEEEYQKTLKKE